MLLPRRLAILLASCLLAAVPAVAPASAWAQSAGDEQYADPLAEPEGGEAAEEMPPLSTDPQASQSSGSGSGSAPAQPAAAAAQAGTAEDASADPPAETAPRTAATELPRTGLDAGVVGLLGLAVLLLGIGLRLRVADVRP